MDVVTYSDARKNLKAVMDRVVNDCDHTVITRQGGEPVVMLSLSEWNSIQETAHLLSSPKNAARLAEGIAQLEAGDVVEVDLDELLKAAE
ncbi:MAG: type II toxin-antitoxin system prevent-host-death family antitoxin [Sphingomonadaceae bacterium]